MTERKMLMKCAADFRAIARDALRGKWLIAVVTGFVASLMGAGIASGGGSSINFILCARSATARKLAFGVRKIKRFITIFAL